MKEQNNNHKYSPFLSHIASKLKRYKKEYSNDHNEKIESVINSGMKGLLKFIMLLLLLIFACRSVEAQMARVTVELDGIFIPDDYADHKDAWIIPRHEDHEYFYRYIFSIDILKNGEAISPSKYISFNENIGPGDNNNYTHRFVSPGKWKTWVPSEVNDYLYRIPKGRSENDKPQHYKLLDVFFNYDNNLSDKYEIRVKYHLSANSSARIEETSTFPLLLDGCGTFNTGNNTFIGGKKEWRNISYLTKKGTYRVNVNYHVNNSGLPNDTILCSNYIRDNYVYLSTLFKKRIQGYDGDIHLFDYDNNGVPKFTPELNLPTSTQQVTSFPEPNSEDVKGGGFATNQYAYYIWRDEFGNVVETSYGRHRYKRDIYESNFAANVVRVGLRGHYNNSPNTTNIPLGAERRFLNINSGGTYTFEGGYYEPHNQKFIITSEETVVVKSRQSPIIDHVEDLYYLCPGEKIILGEGYPDIISPPDQNGIDHHLYDDPKALKITYQWDKLPDPTNLSDKPKCLGYSKIMDFTEFGDYRLTITHDHIDKNKGDAPFTCSTTKKFTIVEGNQPVLEVGPAYREICADEEITLSAAVVTNPNEYNYEWYTGQNRHNTADIQVDRPGVYEIIAKHKVTGCYVTKAVTVVACGEQNYDKIKIVPKTNLPIENADINTDGTHDLRLGATITVVDNDHNTYSNNDPLVEKHALVRLNYNRGSHTDIINGDKWDLEIEYTIEGIINGNPLPLKISNVDETPVYLAANDHQIDPSRDNITLTVTGITATKNGGGVDVAQLPEDISIELDLNIIHLEPLDKNDQNKPRANIDGYKAHIEWDAVDGAVEYELQIAYEDAYMEQNQQFDIAWPTAEKDKYFKNYGYTIETVNIEHYDFNVTYPEGKLHLRYRAVGRHLEDVGGNYSYRNYGDWSDVKTLLIGTDAADDVMPFVESENWQKTIIFAEEGKHKEVISYFDNTLRGSQTVTNLSTDGTVLRTHSYYDKEGRGLLQTLPYPELEEGQGKNGLKFETPQYEVKGTGQLLSSEDFEFGVQPSFETGNDAYGAAKYYSNNNEFLGDPRFSNIDYVPDAEGYISTQTVPTRDATGRVSRQSGVGEAFSLKKSGDVHHETRYYYGEPSSTELRRLFGSNVGDAAHYKMQSVLDPNGQVSISYMDMQDRTIATMLAGAVPKNTVPLERNKEAITVSLLYSEDEDGNTSNKNIWNPVKSAFTLSHDVFNKNLNTDYRFNYDIATVVNKIKYSFPGMEEVFGQDYFENVDGIDDESDDWVVTGGTASLSRGFLLLDKTDEQTFSASLTIPVIANERYNITVKKGSTLDGLTYEILGGIKIKEETYPHNYVTASGPVEMQDFGDHLLLKFEPESNTITLKINYTGPEQGVIGQLDFVKLYLPEVLPELYTALEFDSETDATENSADIAGISFSGSDGVLGKDLYVTKTDAHNHLSMVEIYEDLEGDDGNGNTMFEAAITIPFDPLTGPNAADRNYEAVFNMSRFDSDKKFSFAASGTNIKNLDGDNGTIDVDIVNKYKFTVTPSGGAVTFTWTGEVPEKKDENTSQIELLQLNYFKIYELVEEPSAGVFDTCKSCVYTFKTYILNQDGEKIALNGNDGLREIVQKITADELLKCGDIPTTDPVEANIFDLEMGSQHFNNGNVLDNLSAVSLDECNNCFKAYFPLPTNPSENYQIDRASSLKIIVGEEGDNLTDPTVSLSTAPSRLCYWDGSEYKVDNNTANAITTEIRNQGGALAVNGSTTFEMEVSGGFLFVTITNMGQDVTSVDFSINELPNGNNSYMPINSSPEITFTANFGDIGTYTVYKELEISSARIEAFLERQKEKIKDGYLYNYINEQLDIQDVDALCVYRCEDIAVTNVVARINELNDIDFDDPDRLKFADVVDCYDKGVCPLEITQQAWKDLVDQEILTLDCDYDNLDNIQRDLEESAQIGCEGMRGEMIRQVSSPRGFYMQAQGEYADWLISNIADAQNLVLGEELTHTAIQDWLAKLSDWIDDDKKQALGLDLSDNESKAAFLVKHWNGEVLDGHYEQYEADYQNVCGCNDPLDMPLYDNSAGDNAYETWDDYFVLFHREYIHFVVCEMDIKGSAYTASLRSIKDWDAALKSTDGKNYVDNIYKLDDFITRIEKGTEVRERFEKFFNIKGLGGLKINNPQTGKFYSDDVSLKDFLHKNGLFSCFLYSADEDLNTDDHLLQIKEMEEGGLGIEQMKYWTKYPVCISEACLKDDASCQDPNKALTELKPYSSCFDCRENEALTPEKVSEIKWQTYLGIYDGIRDSIKRVFIGEENYYTDKYSIVNKSSNTIEQVNEIVTNAEFFDDWCETTCETNVNQWIYGFELACEAQRSGNEGPFDSPEGLPFDEKDEVKDFLSNYCLENCSPENPFGWILPEGPNGNIINLLNDMRASPNVTLALDGCMETLIAGYEALVDNSNPGDETIEGHWITTTLVTDAEIEYTEETYELCGASPCAGDIVDHFWLEEKSVETFTSNNCLFDSDNIYFKGDNITIGSPGAAGCVGNCYTNYFWVNAEGDRVHLMPNEYIRDITYSEGAPLVQVNFPSKFEIQPQFSFYKGYVRSTGQGGNVNDLDIVTCLESCSYETEWSDFFPVSSNGGNRYILGLYDGQKNSVLGSNNTYYLESTREDDLTLEDLQIPLSFIFDFSDNNNVTISFEEKVDPNGPVGDVFIEDCEERRTLLINTTNDATLIDEYTNMSCDQIGNLYISLYEGSDRAYKLIFNNLPEDLGSGYTVLFKANILERLTLSKVDNSCFETNKCTKDYSSPIFLYRLSFDNRGKSCNSENEDLCKTYRGIANITLPGQDIAGEYYVPGDEEKRQDCIQDWLAVIELEADEAFEADWAKLKTDLLNKFIDRCKTVKEDYYYQYILDEHHYTLYYYDQVGNLLQTIPPEGVVTLPHTDFLDGKWIGNEDPKHYLRTRYKYNSRNQVIWQETPDAGESEFFYNDAGQLVFSQNDEQEKTRDYSFTAYDNQGRITWVGELKEKVFIDAGGDLDGNGSITYDEVQALVDLPLIESHERNLVLHDAATVTAKDITQLTHTVYDNPVYLEGLAQENLRNRVSATYRYDDCQEYIEVDQGTLPLAAIDFTGYSYDALGNVTKLMQHIGDPMLTSANAGNPPYNNRSKCIEYEFDLVSGNVNKVYYQKNVDKERFIHKYEYDADNRITNVYTSRDNVLWEQEAEYFYYPHGPLARAEIGNDKVQALDYYYTLQGWLKGVNGRYESDPGKDGTTINQFIARDKFAMQLGYYKQDIRDGNGVLVKTISDYKGIANDGLAANLLDDKWEAKQWDDDHQRDIRFKNILEGDGDPAAPYHGLYNGNIALQYTYLPAFGDEAEMINHYQYDQLNRIKGAVGSYYNSVNNQLVTAGAERAYQTAYNYDAMGNITKLYREKDDEAFDELDYFYNYKTGTNKLLNNKLDLVSDAIDEGAHNNDIDDQPTIIGNGIDNYTYDNIGNLVTDLSEQIDKIDWDVYGKITHIKRLSSSWKSDLEFRYDAAGNRIMKIEKPKRDVGGTPTLEDESNWQFTRYIRDAQGNILNTEVIKEQIIDNNPQTVTINEYNIYGSSRLGMYKYIDRGWNSYGEYYTEKGYKNYELTNHLGNVMAVVNDKKLFNPFSERYNALLASAQNYYPFGMQMYSEDNGTYEELSIETILNEAFDKDCNTTFETNFMEPVIATPYEELFTASTNSQLMYNFSNDCDYIPTPDLNATCNALRFYDFEEQCGDAVVDFDFNEQRTTPDLFDDFSTFDATKYIAFRNSAVLTHNATTEKLSLEAVNNGHGMYINLTTVVGQSYTIILNVNSTTNTDYLHVYADATGAPKIRKYDNGDISYTFTATDIATKFYVLSYGLLTRYTTIDDFRLFENQDNYEILTTNGNVVTGIDIGDGTMTLSTNGNTNQGLLVNVPTEIDQSYTLSFDIESIIGNINFIHVDAGAFDVYRTLEGEARLTFTATDVNTPLRIKLNGFGDRSITLNDFKICKQIGKNQRDNNYANITNYGRLEEMAVNANKFQFTTVNSRHGINVYLPTQANNSYTVSFAPVLDNNTQYLQVNIDGKNLIHTDKNKPFSYTFTATAGPTTRMRLRLYDLSGQINQKTATIDNLNFCEVGGDYSMFSGHGTLNELAIGGDKIKFSVNRNSHGLAINIPTEADKSYTVSYDVVFLYNTEYLTNRVDGKLNIKTVKGKRVHYTFAASEAPTSRMLIRLYGNGEKGAEISNLTICEHQTADYSIIDKIGTLHDLSIDNGELRLSTPDNGRGLKLNLPTDDAINESYTLSFTAGFVDNTDRIDVSATGNSRLRVTEGGPVHYTFKAAAGDATAVNLRLYGGIGNKSAVIDDLELIKETSDYSVFKPIGTLYQKAFTQDALRFSVLNNGHGLSADLPTVNGETYTATFDLKLIENVEEVRVSIPQTIGTLKYLADDLVSYTFKAASSNGISKLQLRLYNNTDPSLLKTAQIDELKLVQVSEKYDAFARLGTLYTMDIGNGDLSFTMSNTTNSGINIDLQTEPNKSYTVSFTTDAENTDHIWTRAVGTTYALKSNQDGRVSYTFVAPSADTRVQLKLMGDLGADKSCAITDFNVCKNDDAYAMFSPHGHANRFDFDDDALTLDFAAEGNGVRVNLVGLETNKDYELTFDIPSFQNVDRIRISGGNSAQDYPPNGTAAYKWTASSATASILIRLYGDVNFDKEAVIDNFKVIYEATTQLAFFNPDGEKYRFGFNGMEKDDELSGQGNAYTTHYRGYDPRLGRWKSIDPVKQEWQSPYSAMDNNPILYNDPYGNCRNCDIHSNPNGGRLTVPSGTKILSKGENGAARWFVHDNVDYVWDDSQNGYYGSTDDGVKRWSNPNSQRMDFIANSTFAIAQSLKPKNIKNSISGLATVMAEASRVESAGESYALDKVLGGNSNSPVLPSTPAADAMGDNIIATFNGMPDWSGEEWATGITTLGISMYGPKAGFSLVGKARYIYNNTWVYNKLSVTPGVSYFRYHGTKYTFALERHTLPHHGLGLQFSKIFHAHVGIKGVFKKTHHLNVSMLINRMKMEGLKLYKNTPLIKEVLEDSKIPKAE